MAYNYFNQQNLGQPQQANPNQFQNPLFPQPNGNVYTISSSNELSTIPVGMGLTVVLCINENLLYLKSIQNGNPVVWSYKLSTNEQTAQIDETKEEEKYTLLDKRLSKLERHWEEMFDERFKS